MAERRRSRVPGTARPAAARAASGVSRRLRAENGITPRQYVEVIAAIQREMRRDIGASVEEGVPWPGAEDGVVAWSIRDHVPAGLREGSPIPPLDDRAKSLVALAQAVTFLSATDTPLGLQMDSGDAIGASITLLYSIRGERVVGVAYLWADFREATYDADAPTLFGNVWVAHDHRRRGVAEELLAHARDRFPITHLGGPFSPKGDAWARAVAPDLYERHQADPFLMPAAADLQRRLAES